jgi:hypothetical protein
MELIDEKKSIHIKISWNCPFNKNIVTDTCTGHGQNMDLDFDTVMDIDTVTDMDMVKNTDADTDMDTGMDADIDTGMDMDMDTDTWAWTLEF